MIATSLLATEMPRFAAAIARYLGGAPTVTAIAEK